MSWPRTRLTTTPTAGHPGVLRSARCWRRGAVGVVDGPRPGLLRRWPDPECRLVHRHRYLVGGAVAGGGCCGQPGAWPGHGVADRSRPRPPAAPLRVGLVAVGGDVRPAARRA